MAAPFDFMAELPAQIVDWMLSAGNLPAVADCVALGGAGVAFALAARAMHQRDMARRALALLRAANAERLNNAMPTPAEPTTRFPVSQHLPADVTVRIPAIDPEGLAQWRVPTAQEMSSWVRRASSGRDGS